MRRLLAAALCLTLLCACAVASRQPRLVEQGPDRAVAARVAATAASDPAALTSAIEHSLAYVRTRPAAEKPFGDGGPDCTWGQLVSSLEHLHALIPALAEDPDLLAREFRWIEVRPDPLMTGYYEPEMEGSLEPDPRFPVPLYGLPADLHSVDLGRFHPRWKGQRLTYRQDEKGIEPYYSREEIDVQGALALTERPLAWTRDPADVFFLQIQGSGRLRLPDGSVRHVLYAGKNGHEYVSLGKVMIERGLIPADAMSMQRIRAYLREHPHEAQELLNTNPSYVFSGWRRTDRLGPWGGH